MRRLLLLCALCCALLCGCVSQSPVLLGEPTPQPTPTPPLPEIQSDAYYAGEEQDALGIPIYDADTHFMRYLSFENLRVYEYSGDTFLDGICNNAYPAPLYGRFLLEFRDGDGVLIAEAALYFDGSQSLIPPGETKLYATIDTDMSVDMLPLSLIALQSVQPYDPVE